MINEEKVKNMAKAAAYESGIGKKNIPAGDFYKEDYLGLQLIKSALAYIAAFCMLTVLWAMGRMEELMLQLSRAEYLQNFAKNLLILFVIGLVVYEVLIYFYYSWKYERIKESLSTYQSHLKEVSKFYETDEADEEGLVEIDLSDEEN